jgi:hypothetical protein
MSAAMARANLERAPSRRVLVSAALSAILTSVGVGGMVAAQSAAAQEPIPPKGPAPAATVLTGSEIVVVESGGITGRIHSVRLFASDGRVQVEYRPPGNRAGFTGAIESERFLSIWRKFEEAGIWSMRSPAPTKGADLAQVEVRIRLAETTQTIRWDELNQAMDVRGLATIAREALALGQQATMSR